MAMPYSHLALARGCAATLAIVDPAAFALGAIAPDLRYFTGHPRDHTHFALAHLDHLAATTVTPADVVLGYRVHLLIDDVWYTTPFPETFRARFPAALRPRLTPKLLETLLEYGCLTARPLTLRLAPQANGLTRALGLTTADLARGVAAMQHELDQPTLQTGLTIAQHAGVASPARLAQMRRLAQAVEQRPFWRVLAALVLLPPTRAAYADMVGQVLARRSHVGAHPDVPMHVLRSAARRA